MARTSTLLRFAIEVADVDRGVYEALDLRVAQHPSEELERVVVRVLARCLLHEEGLEFGAGLSTAEEPALWTRTPEGDVTRWVDVGAPSAERLHKASKLAGRVDVWSAKPRAVLAQAWSGQRIHGADAIAVTLLPAAFIEALVETLDRRVAWVVTRTEGCLSVSTGAGHADCELVEVPLSEL